jgi:hypothetical protein
LECWPKRASVKIEKEKKNIFDVKKRPLAAIDWSIRTHTHTHTHESPITISLFQLGIFTRLNSTRFSSEEKKRRRREKNIYITQPLPNNKSQRREIKSRLKLISLSTAFFFPPPLFSPGYMYFYIFLSGGIRSAVAAGRHTGKKWTRSKRFPQKSDGDE